MESNQSKKQSKMKMPSVSMPHQYAEVLVYLFYQNKDPIKAKKCMQLNKGITTLDNKAQQK